MIAKIPAVLPSHTISIHDDIELYVVDYKNENNGDIEISSIPPPIDYVFINNSNKVKVCFDGFKDRALPLPDGTSCKQCECLIFPHACVSTNWVLFIETKYINNLKKSIRKGYPNKAITQITETVNYFRLKGILDPTRRIHAIVSFPKLLSPFDSVFSTNAIFNRLIPDHNIILRGTNSASIIDNDRIRL